MGYIVFALVVVEVFIRFISSFATNTSILELVSIPIWEKWVIGLTAALFCIWFWNKFIRRRCPQCKSTKYNFLGEKEIDRWLGTKQVTEKLASGKTKTRTVNTTFIKIQRFFKCNDCGHDWSEISKEEKT
jgi:hypothetical protein